MEDRGAQAEEAQLLMTTCQDQEDRVSPEEERVLQTPSSSHPPQEMALARKEPQQPPQQELEEAQQ